MENNYIFVPVIIQVALTLWLYIYLAMAKSRAVKSGEVNEERRALHDDAWPDSVLQINNCIRNQFEAPLLFYVLIIILWSIGGANIFVHIAAWIFALSRIGHAVVHTGSNYVPIRRQFFMAGCFILIGLTSFAFYKSCPVELRTKSINFGFMTSDDEINLASPRNLRGAVEPRVLSHFWFKQPAP